MITAADFFTVEVLSMAGLIRYHVFFVIDIATRKVEIARIKAASQRVLDATDRPEPAPPRSPDLNAFAERFVLSIKSECLNRIVPLGERHLRHVISEFVATIIESEITRASKTS